MEAAKRGQLSTVRQLLDGGAATVEDQDEVKCVCVCVHACVGVTSSKWRVLTAVCGPIMSHNCHNTFFSCFPILNGISILLPTRM